MYVIITEDEKVMEMAKRAGAKILACTKAGKERLNVSEKLNRNTFISSELLRLGIPANLTGFKYIRCILEMSVTDPNFSNFNLNQEVYPKVARKNGVVPESVSKTVRRTINLLFEENNTKLLTELFPTSVKTCTKPTNSEFIGVLSVYIKEKLGS